MLAKTSRIFYGGARLSQWFERLDLDENVSKRRVQIRGAGIVSSAFVIAPSVFHEPRLDERKPASHQVDQHAERVDAP
jgi:hypothetical protein